MAVVKVLISFNGLRAGEFHTVPFTPRIRAFVRLGYLQPIALDFPEPVYCEAEYLDDIPEDGEDLDPDEDGGE